jgi:hypothetical protein
MLGSISSELLPIDDSGTPAPRALTARTPASDAARHEPAAAAPLLRERGAALVDEDSSNSEREGPAAAVQIVVGQLAPIRSHESLSSSFAREANPDDPVVLTAYACVWADLAMSMALGTTRRARRRATMAAPRRTPVRGRG